MLTVVSPLLLNVSAVTVFATPKLPSFTLTVCWVTLSLVVIVPVKFKVPLGVDPSVIKPREFVPLTFKVPLLIISLPFVNVFVTVIDLLASLVNVLPPATTNVC